MNNIANDQQHEASHILYSKGYVFDDFDYFESLKKISEFTHRSQIQVQERILCCRTKRIKSSSDLSELIALEDKLKSMGLDVYIETH